MDIMVDELSAEQISDLMAKCNQRLEVLRMEAIQHAESLGMTCVMPKAQKKKGRNSRHEPRAD
jgi:hypothetical protein